jgi:hypothetical protein
MYAAGDFGNELEISRMAHKGYHKLSKGKSQNKTIVSSLLSSFLGTVLFFFYIKPDASDYFRSYNLA